MRLILSLLFGALVSCANTTLYDKGEKIVDIQCDASEFTYTRSADGSVSVRIVKMDHSTPTRAQGESSASKAKAIGGAVAASGITAILVQ